MREYEITYLANPQLEDAAKDKLDEAVDAEITKRDGHITGSFPSTGAPGSRRRLHYPLARQRLAWLRTMQVKLEENQIESLYSTLRKLPSILRLTTIQTPPRPEVSAAVLDSLMERDAKEAAAPDNTIKPLPAVTMSEVEEKIAKALEEEVK